MQTLSYDGVTGLPLSLSDGSTADASSYDSFGRLTSYIENTSAAGAQTNTATVGYDQSTGRVTSRRDQHQRINYTYNGGGEHRGLPTSAQVEVTASNNNTALWTGTYAAAYDSDGRPVTQTDPNGITTTLTRDENGQLVTMADTVTATGASWLTDSALPSIHGQWLHHANNVANQDYAYDAAGRLTQAKDTPTGGACTTRRYGFDANSNRTGTTTATVGLGAPCASGTAPDATINYDSADRLLTAGTLYDAFGRTTTAPASTVTGGGDVTVGYYANDLVASQTQGGNSQTWTLDPTQQRFRRTVVTGATTADRTNHYDASSGDSPAWIAENTDGTAWTANVVDLFGSLAATVDQSGTATFQYASLHGDVLATATSSVAPSFTPDTDEYGNRPAGDSTRYGWLGAKQRSGDDLGGLLLMGVRLYNPTTGRFLQTDPIVGGNENAYVYPADPINRLDLDGRASGAKGNFGKYQAAWCALAGLIACYRANKARNWAKKYYHHLVNDLGFSDNVADAFMHVIWIARVTNAVGGTMARALGRAHEMDTNNNNATDRRRDLMNNDLGSHFSGHDRRSNDAIIAHAWELFRSGRLNCVSGSSVVSCGSRTD